MKKPRKERRIARRLARKRMQVHLAYITNKYGRRNYMTPAFKEALEQATAYWDRSGQEPFCSFLDIVLDPPAYAERLAETQRRLEHMNRIVGGQSLATAEQVGVNLRAAGFTSYPPVEFMVIPKPG